MIQRGGKSRPRVVASALTLLFVIGMSVWAAWAGMRLRTNIWQQTRSIRFFVMDNGFRLGSNALREAETQAGLPDYSDVVAGQTPEMVKKISSAPSTEGGQMFDTNVAAVPANVEKWATDPNLRRITVRELLKGIVHFYDRVVAENPGGDYNMDYSPMRLMIMAMWARHEQRLHPEMLAFSSRRPNPRAPAQVMRFDTPLPRPEDAALSVVNFNTACTGAAAIAMFALVWLWIARIAPRPIAENSPSAFPHGLITFMVSAAGFWMLLIQTGGIPSRPAPALQITSVETAGDSVTVNLNVNSFANSIRWRIDWGSSAEKYEHSTRPRPIAGAVSGNLNPKAVLPGMTPGEIIHLRGVAFSSDPTGSDTTTTDDITYTVGGKKLLVQRPVSGGSSWPGWTFWIRMLVLMMTMLISARMLPQGYRGLACGLIAGLFVWLNPPTIVDALILPQWDVWILPVIVAMFLMASLGWWLTAGALLALGAMLKAQILIGAPILLVWPLFAGKFNSFLRVCVGFALAMGLFAWPWLVRTKGEVTWMLAIPGAGAIALIATPFYVRQIKKYFTRTKTKLVKANRPVHPIVQATVMPTGAEERSGIWKRGYWAVTSNKDHWLHWKKLVARGFIFAGLIICAIIIFKHSGAVTPIQKKYLWGLFGAILIVPLFLPRKMRSTWILLLFTIAFWIAPSMYDGSFSWLKAGILYGGDADNHNNMVLSAAVVNLPAILDSVGWGLHDIVGKLDMHLKIFRFSLDKSFEPEMRHVLWIIYGILIALCGIAAAIHWRRRDPRTLAAILAPWVIFPIVMGQMSDRYFMWGAAVSAAMVAVSSGMTLIHVLFAILSGGMILRPLMMEDNGRWPQASDFIAAMRPNAGWLMILIALIFLASALSPRHAAGGKRSITRS